MLPGLDGVTRVPRDPPRAAPRRRADPDADGAARRVRQGQRARERRRRLPDQAVRRPRVRRARARAAAPAPRRANASAHTAPVTRRRRCTSIRRGGRRALDDREIELTAHEFDLLYVLASNRGIVFSRDALVQRVWGGDTHITERSVDTLVKRLRKKIEDDPAEPRYISPCGARATSSPMPERVWYPQPLLAHRARLRRAARGAAARAGRAVPVADHGRFDDRARPDAGAARRAASRRVSDSSRAGSDIVDLDDSTFRRPVLVDPPAVYRDVLHDGRRVVESRHRPVPPRISAGWPSRAARASSGAAVLGRPRQRRGGPGQP